MLLKRENATVTDAMERLFGMQAQLARPPYVGLFSRIEGFRAEDLTAAIERRTVVRATLMRGTLHVMTAKDYVAFRPVLQMALDHGLKSVLRDRMKAVQTASIVSMARAFFATPHTFDELRDSLAGKEPVEDVRARAYAARCLVPLVQVSDGSRWGYPGVARFTLADAWIKPSKKSTAADLGDLVRRYLAAFGPASVTDAQTWSGIPALGPTFTAMRDELVLVHQDRKELWDLPKAPRPDEDTPAPPVFLPEFDNLVLAYADRKRFVADAHRKAIYLPGLRVAPTFLVDGVVAGVWKVVRVKAKATLQVEPFDTLSAKVKKALGDEASRLVRFIEPDAATFDVRFS
jgi:hypothetical protein